MISEAIWKQSVLKTDWNLNLQRDWKVHPQALNQTGDKEHSLLMKLSDLPSKIQQVFMIIVTVHLDLAFSILKYTCPQSAEQSTHWDNISANNSWHDLKNSPALGHCFQTMPQ